MSSRRAAGAVCAAAFLPVVAVFGIIVLLLAAPASMVTAPTSGNGTLVLPDSPYLLERSELPGNIILYTANEIESGLIAKGAKDYGCLKEYSMMYATEKPSPPATRNIRHFIMIFTPGNASKMVQSDEKYYRGGWCRHEMPMNCRHPTSGGTAASVTGYRARVREEAANTRVTASYSRKATSMRSSSPMDHPRITNS